MLIKANHCSSVLNIISYTFECSLKKKYVNVTRYIRRQYTDRSLKIKWTSCITSITMRFVTLTCIITFVRYETCSENGTNLRSHKHNLVNSVEIPTRCSFVIEFIIPKFIEGSTCFERHTARHQEL